MSVDVVAMLGEPVTLEAVLRSGRQVLTDLLGVAAPQLVAFADREYENGVRIGQGRQLAAAELRETVIGHTIPASETGIDGSVHFEIDVPATGDGVYLMAIDHQGEELEDGRHAVFTPYRTCVGVTVAVALALATVRLARGRYVDEIGMVLFAENDPDDIIHRTRLSRDSKEFSVQCEKYVRQFHHLEGWPRDRTMR